MLDPVRPAGPPTSAGFHRQAVAELRRQLPGVYDDRQELLRRIALRAGSLDILVADASAALSGDTSAAARLRDQLCRRIPGRPSVDTVFDDRHARLDHDVVGTLVAGAMWAAATPGQAAAMVHTAVRLLETFDSLSNVAGHAIGGDRTESLSLDKIDDVARLGTWVIAMPPDDGPPLGPDDGPLHDFPELFKPPQKKSWIEAPLIKGYDYLSPFVCILGALSKVAKAQESGPRYAITSIDPPKSCHFRAPAPLITITGTGFGSTGTVLFRSVDGPDARIEVTAESWSDTEVVVKQPLRVASGPIELRIQFGELELCKQTFPLYRLASGLQPFDSEPAAYALTVDGKLPPAVLTPETDVQVQWLASASPKTRVVITVKRTAVPSGAVLSGPTVIFDQFGGGSGSVPLHLPAALTVETLHVTMDVGGLCTAHHESNGLSRDYLIAPLQSLEVYGLEVTQMYQNHHGLEMSHAIAPLAPAHRILTVEKKATVVRAYVGFHDGGLLGGSLPNITGRLLVGTDTFLPWKVPTVTAQETVPRRPIGATLNFRISDGVCLGTKDLTLQVWGSDAAGRPVSASYSMQWTWFPAHALKVRWVKVVDTRPNPLPSVSDFERERAVYRGFDYLPSPALDIDRAVVPTIGSSKDQMSEDDRSDIRSDLDDVKDEADRPDELWVGVLCSPDTGGVAYHALGAYSHTVVAAANPVVVAHEIAHSRKRPHTDGSCLGGPAPENSNPLVPPDAFIVNVPIDPWNVLTIEAPAGQSLGDLMSYCCVRATGGGTWSAIYASLP